MLLIKLTNFLDGCELVTRVLYIGTEVVFLNFVMFFFVIASLHYWSELKSPNFSLQICSIEHVDEGCNCRCSGSAEAPCNNSGMCKGINSAAFLLVSDLMMKLGFFTNWEVSDLTFCLGFWWFNSEKSPWTCLRFGEWN